MDNIAIVDNAANFILQNNWEYYGLDPYERLQREVESIEKNNLWADLEKLFQNPCPSNPCNSLILWANNICEEEPKGEFVPVVSIESGRGYSPDIDLDVSGVRRAECINYIKEKMQAYPIIAFSQLGQKSGIKELGRSLGFPYSMMDAITKSVEEGTPTKITDAITYKYPNFFEEVKGLEGAINHSTIHASGIAVFSGEPHQHYLGLRKAPRTTEVVVDMDGDTMGQVGIMKVDLLGSLTTDVIAETEELADMKLPPDDELLYDQDTINGFTKCDVSGIFQAGGHTNKRVFSTIRPTSFNEVADCISLARPGTKEQIPAYCKWQSDINNQLVQELLQPTRGVLLYQEQVLLLGKEIGGLSGTEAEQLRSAIAKKKSGEYIEHLQEKFLVNAKETIGEDSANQLWDMINKHILYSFNKSHAVAYTTQAFRQMWLKNNYPTEFWCATFNHAKEDEKYEYRYEIAKTGIEMLLPSYNACYTQYTVPMPGFIQLPVTAIKGIGNNVDWDLDKLSGAKNIFEAVRALKNIQKRNLDNLINIGFFDAFNSNRTELLNTIEQKGQTSLFDDILPQPNKINPYDVEKELLGFWVSSHPAMHLDGCYKIKDVLDYGGEGILGVVDDVRITKDGKGNSMAFMKVGDDTYFANCVIFHQALERIGNVPYVGEIVHLIGNVRNESFIVNDIQRL